MTDTFFGRIEGVQGVWANEDTLEACREELRSAFEDWILFSPAGWCGTPAHRWYGLERGQERLMPRFGPTSRRDLIAALRKTGFTGPRQGGKHAFMLKNGIRVIIPNPHRSEFGCCLPSCGKQG